MSAPEHDPTGEEILELLRQPLAEDVRHFAHILLYSYRDEAMKAARSDGDREQREARVAEARQCLRDKLRRLLAWAKETRRM